MKSILSVLIIGCYILCCFMLKTGPWRYFQINARLFSRDKGIFSKLAIDELIPQRWRLSQKKLDASSLPDQYPVFIKPEWGQNASGIERADNASEFQAIARRVIRSGKPHIVQDAAPGLREFEIYTTFTGPDANTPDIVTVTETINATHRYPINSIYNDDTIYRDITAEFTKEQLQQLVSYKREIGKFGQSRLSVRANTTDDLLNGNFHVIEINLFTPMPINLMDQSYTWKRKLGFILQVGRSLARVTRAIDRNQKSFPVFTRMMLYSHQRSPLGAVLRSFL